MGTRQPVRKLWQQTGEREGREWRRGGRPQNLECLQAQGEETLSKKPKWESGQGGRWALTVLRPPGVRCPELPGLGMRCTPTPTHGQRASPSCNSPLFKGILLGARPLAGNLNCHYFMILLHSQESTETSDVVQEHTLSSYLLASPCRAHALHTMSTECALTDRRNYIPIRTTQLCFQFC